MTERPIIFSGPMVRALLAGRKTQTRRIVKGIDECPHGYDGVVTATVPKEAHLVGKHCFNLASGESLYLRCPYGVPGDRLWVRETHAGDNLCGWVYRADHPNADIKAGELDDGEQSLRRWTPAIHMRREACRLKLELTGVRVERVQDISAKDAVREGVTEKNGRWCDAKGEDSQLSPIAAYRSLWDSLNAKRGYGWDANPWVWVLSFTRLAS